MTKVELLEKYGNLTAAAKALRIPRQTLQSRLNKFGSSDLPGKEAPTGKGLAEFRATHDKSYIVPERIKEGFKLLGANCWEYESNFARLANVSIADLSIFREDFADHVVVVRRDGKRIWAGSASLATKMKQMLV